MRLRASGVESAGTTSDTFAATIQADIAHCTPIVKASGFSVE